MNKQSAFFYSPVFLKHKAPDFHPERPERLQAILRAIKNDSSLKDLPFFEPKEADGSVILLNHTFEHLEKVKNLKGSGYIDQDTYYSPSSAKAAFTAAGAGVEALDKILSNEIQTGICLVRPPGHHAEASRAMGFCLLNNAAITARYANKNGIDKTVLIDFDVHHGNGSQHSFYDNDRLLYISVHHYPIFPGTGSVTETGTGKGRGFNINIPFPGTAADADYKEAFDNVVHPIVTLFKPDLLLISAGFDAHANDPLGGMALSDAGFGYMASKLRELDIKRTILFLEGGYDLKALESSSLKTFRFLADIDLEAEEITGEAVHGQTIEQVRTVQKEFWSL